MVITMNAGYWIKQNKVINIGNLRHEEHAFRSGLVKTFKDEHETRLEVLKQGFCRVRQYRNHWSVELLQNQIIPVEELRGVIAKEDKFGEVYISFITSHGMLVDKYKTTINKLV